MNLETYTGGGVSVENLLYYDAYLFYGYISSDL